MVSTNKEYFWIETVENLSIQLNCDEVDEKDKDALDTIDEDPEF